MRSNDTSTLCGLADLLLTHHSMDAVRAQATKANAEVSLPTMNECLDALRDRLRHDQVRQSLKRQRHHKLRKRLERYLLAA